MLRQLQEMRSLSEVVSLRRGRCRWKQSMQYVVRPESRRLIIHCYKGIRLSVNNKVTSLGNFVPNYELSHFFWFSFRHGMSITGSLPHWTSTFVYDNMGVTQRVARIHLRPLRLVLVKNVILARRVLPASRCRMVYILPVFLLSSFFSTPNLC